MLTFTLAIFSLLVFCGCEEIEEEKPWIQVERPDMLFTDTTLMDSYDKGILAWKLKTAYLERWSKKDLVFVRPVFVDIFDSLGERSAFLRADSGRMDMKFTYVHAYGHVYALTPKGASVRSDSLIWSKKDNLVRTDSYVRVVTEDGDVLQGKGFVSDAQLDNWHIISNVTGIFQDAAKRIKEEDEKEAKEMERRNKVSSQAPKKEAPKADHENKKDPEVEQVSKEEPKAEPPKKPKEATKDDAKDELRKPPKDKKPPKKGPRPSAKKRED